MNFTDAEVVLMTSMPTSSSQKGIGRTAFDVFQGITGSIMFLLALVILTAYYVATRRRGQKWLKKHFSFMTLTTICVCLIHGLIFSIGYSIHRNRRYKMSAIECVISSLIFECFENFYQLTLILLSLEKLLIVCFPLTSARKLKRVMIGLFVSMIFINMLFAVPYFVATENSLYQNKLVGKPSRRLRKFYMKYTCEWTLHRNNPANQFVFLGLQIFAVAFVLFSSATILFRIQNHLFNIPNISYKRKKFIRSSSKFFAVLLAVVILTNLPYGIVEVLRNSCDLMYKNDREKSKKCVDVFVNARFITRIIFHLGNLSPLLICFSHKKIRAGMKDWVLNLCCCPSKVSHLSNISDTTNHVINTQVQMTTLHTCAYFPQVINNEEQAL